MSDTTKKLLAQSMIKLCSKFKLNKITIQDIVDDCGVNRNTFYYHFKDIYDILDYIFKEEEKKALANISDYNDWQQGILLSIDSVKEYKSMIFNVYNSVNREQLERYLYHTIEILLLRYLKSLYPDINTSSDDMKMIIDFYKCANVGIVLEWIGNGMKGDIITLSSKMKILTNNIIEHSISNMKLYKFIDKENF